MVMTRIVVYEFVSAGGLADAPGVEAELMPLGRSMREAMCGDLRDWAQDQPDIRISVADCAAAPVPPAAGVTVCRAANGQAPLDFVAELVATHDLVWMVAPESGGLLQQCQALAGDARWLGCRPPALAIASSKRLTLQALHAAGLATPLSLAQDGGAARWVVKPDDGAGAVDTAVFADRAAAEAAARHQRAAGRDPTLEPWVEGPAMSLSLWQPPDRDDPEAVQLLSLNHQDLQWQARADGASDLAFAGVRLGDLPAPGDPRHAALLALARGCVAALPGLSGFFGIDLVWHERLGPVAIEVNPRVSCAYVGQRQRLGRDLAGEWVRAHLARWGRAAAPLPDGANAAASRPAVELSA